MKVLVTGAAGFIGAATCARLVEAGHAVTGVDNFSPYYDPELKHARLRTIPGFACIELDLTDRPKAAKLFSDLRPERVVHLAAQPGVRYSLENPAAYIDANLVATGNVLEGCRRGAVQHLVFASSSSVYGGNTKFPWSPHDNVDHPLSLYAATKKATELMAHSYSHLFSLPVTGLRFFTVYGPWGRPDMVPLLFTQAIVQGRPIEVYNHGEMSRDFTYIDDITLGVMKALDKPPLPHPSWPSDAPDPASSSAPYRIYNLGGGRPVKLLDFIDMLERCLGKKATRKLLPLQPGDVVSTFADSEDTERDFAFRPSVRIEEGLAKMIAWYRRYYG